MPRRCRGPRNARCCATRCAAFSRRIGRPPRRSSAAREPRGGRHASGRSWSSRASPASAASPREGGLRELAMAMEELGRAACPAPLLGAGLANLALAGSRRAASPAKDAARATACRQRAHLLELRASSTRAPMRRARLERRRPSGTLRFVDGAAAATHLVVARSGGRPRPGRRRPRRARRQPGHRHARASAPTAGPRSCWPTRRRAFVPLDDAALADLLAASPASPCSPAPTARRGAPSRWRSTTPRSAGSSASRSAASRRSSTSSPTT